MSGISSPSTSCDPEVPFYERRDNLGRTPLFCAAQTGSFEVLTFLHQELGADPAAKDNRGATPLHIAAYNGHFDIVNYLLEECHLNADPTDDEGNTPMFLAASEGHTEVVKLLIQEGSETNVTTRDGLTLLHVAALHNDVELTQMLC